MIINGPHIILNYKINVNMLNDKFSSNINFINLIILNFNNNYKLNDNTFKYTLIYIYINYINISFCLSIIKKKYYYVYS